MTTGKGLQGRPYWAMLGVALPDHLSDNDADRLMRLILSSPTAPWPVTMALTGTLATMPKREIADLIAEHERELKRYTKRARKESQTVVKELWRRATEHNEAGLLVVNNAALGLAVLRFEPSLNIHLLEPLRQRRELDQNVDVTPTITSVQSRILMPQLNFTT